MDKQGTEKWHDWVGELFEPAFGSTIAELVSGEDTEKQSKIKHVSAYDPEAVKRVYEKVHMMTQLDQEMRKQEAGKNLAAKEGGPLSVTDQTAAEPQEIRSADVEGKVLVDLNDSCIWDSNEIAVLRHAYKTIKQQNIDAMVHVRQVEKRNNELETLAAKQEKVIASQKEKLTNARKANSRLKIHCDKLQSELDYCLAKISAMEEILAEVKQEKSDMVKELHDNRVATDRERMERERIQMKLDTLKQEALAEKMAAEDNVKTMCKQVILDLQKKVTKLTEELNREKSTHRNTAKGLNHLRSHFASLSVQEILPSKAVHHNQVEHIDY